MNPSKYPLFVNAPAPKFHGDTFDPALDQKRLATQLDRVREFLSDGKWRTLAQISAATGAPEASASARIRDLKCERRRVEGSNGLHEYRLQVAEKNGAENA